MSRKQSGRTARSRWLASGREGEKLHEEMITASDAQNTIEVEKYYVILPSAVSGSVSSRIEKCCQHHRGKPVAAEFRYSSGDNDQWLDVPQLRALIREHCDPTFDLT